MSLECSLFCGLNQKSCTVTFWIVFCEDILQIKGSYAILHIRESKSSEDNMEHDVMDRYLC